jgi:hypothetical protein
MKFWVSFGVLEFYKLLRENCGLNVKDAKNLKKKMHFLEVGLSALALCLSASTFKPRAGNFYTTRENDTNTTRINR